jgi:HAMP domain-containing protein
MVQQTVPELDKSPQLTGKLGRKFAFVLLPIVLIPLIVMGAVVYLRMRSTLRQEAVDQMIHTIQGQSTLVLEWASSREQQLSIATQRPEIQAASLELLFRPQDQESISSIQEDLEGLLQIQGNKLFDEVFLLRISDGLVVSSTDEKHVGLSFENPSLMGASEPTTFPLYNDPDLTPEALGFLSISPFHVVGDQPDFYLIGVNSGSEIFQLIEELQVFWQQRGIGRAEAGKSFLALSPAFILKIPPDATDLEVEELPDHEIFKSPISEDASFLEYENQEAQTVLSVYQWIPGWNLALVVELPTSEIFANLSDLAPFMVILIVLAAIFTLGVSFIVTNHMLQPLTTLADFANRISHGEWLYRVPEDREDELGALASSLNRMAEELGALYQSLESRVEDRTQQIRTAAEVARAITSIPNLDELLRQAARLIKDRFGYDHVSIFLLDSSGQQAILRESAGEINGTTRSSGYIVEVNPETLIGWVIQNNTSRIITDISDESEAFKAGLLRGARIQASIPLQIAGRSLGVIDVQNAKQNIFEQEQFEVLQTLADQLSSAIENARLAQESADAAERARLISQITSQLSGILEPQQVLQVAAHALHRALGDAEIVIKWVPPEEIPAEE